VFTIAGKERGERIFSRFCTSKGQKSEELSICEGTVRLQISHISVRPTEKIKTPAVPQYEIQEDGKI
jgi:hypothetical protein